MTFLYERSPKKHQKYSIMTGLQNLSGLSSLFLQEVKMPKYGAHALVWIDEWTTEKGNRAVAAAAQQGFGFIEIPLLKPHDFDAASTDRKSTRLNSSPGY